MDRLRQQELFQEIKEKNDIVSVISEYVSLRKAGRSFSGLCPFHGEKTPSFNVNPEKQFFYCFGCGAGGDVFNFLMKMEGSDFIQAARKLADRAGVAWPELQESDQDRSRNELIRMNQLAASFFHYCLTKSDLGKSGREYLAKRGISETIWQKFQLGFAPAGWQQLTDVIRSKGASLEQAATLGLVGFGEKGYYDRFRDRIMFPIMDPQGNVIGFGGRIMEAGEPKYLNSPETPLFHKGRFLYGLQLAKDAVRKRNQAIIMEGYMDVIQAHQGGFEHAIASLGTALTRDQAKTIKRYAAEVILAYDADTAGQNATLRGMELLHEAGLRVKILRLPSGEDPDSFIKKYGSASLTERLLAAPGLTDFKIEQVLRRYDLQTPEGKNDAVQAILPELAGIESTVIRESYIRQIVRAIGVSENAIIAEIETWLSKTRKKSPVLDNKQDNSYTKTAPAKNSLSLGNMKPKELSPLQRWIFEAEKELLQSALQEYDKFTRIKEKLTVADFHFDIWRELFSAINELSDAPENQHILNELSGSFRELAATLLAEQEFRSTHGDIEGILDHLQMLHMKERIQFLTERIATGRDETGMTLSEPELKRIMLEFTELNRKLKKEYPRFSADL